MSRNFDLSGTELTSGPPLPLLNHSQEAVAACRPPTSTRSEADAYGSLRKVEIEDEQRWDHRGEEASRFLPDSCRFASMRLGSVGRTGDVSHSSGAMPDYRGPYVTYTQHPSYGFDTLSVYVRTNERFQQSMACLRALSVTGTGWWPLRAIASIHNCGETWNYSRRCSENRAGFGAGSDFKSERVGARPRTPLVTSNLLNIRWLCWTLRFRADAHRMVQNGHWCHYESPALTIELQALRSDSIAAHQ